MEQKSIFLPNLLDVESWVDTIAWVHFRPGVEAHFLYGEFGKGPAAVLLRYAPGAGAALHTHTGFEHVFILRGSQTDANGRQSAGSLVINPPGTQHAVSTDGQCVVLVIWEKPVEFA